MSICTRPPKVVNAEIQRLMDYGIQDIFGIPGDYILTFYSMLEQSPIRVVGCCSEDNAGFAGDDARAAAARDDGRGRGGFDFIFTGSPDGPFSKEAGRLDSKRGLIP